MAATLYNIYQRLFNAYGPQHWWPGNSPFEVMVGAVLTQNTSWTNVEAALHNIKQADLLDCKKIIALPQQQLATLLRPVGYFNIKAKRLQSYCDWYHQSGQFRKLNKLDTATLRRQLLAVHGVGPETADDILLYAFGREVFVIDAYTRRLFERLGLVTGTETYETLRELFETKLNRQQNKAQLFNEYHGLIVHHAKYFCRARTPECTSCCLQSVCKFYQRILREKTG